MKMRKAFTLIELLVVMAITAVLLTLIIVPVIQSFGLTRAAQALADAQDKARLVTDRIAREIGNAVSVRDASSVDVSVPDGTGLTQIVELPYTKLDLIPPAQGDAGTSFKNADGTISFRDPNTGKYDPTLTRPKGDVNVNGLPGSTIVRYFVGVNRPLAVNADGVYAGGTAVPYNEPYTGLLMARNGNRDNLIVLRRAEVQPFVYRARKDGKANSLAWRPNLAYFRSDDDRNDNGEFDTRIIDLDDPMFFVPDGQYLRESDKSRQPDPEKNNRVAHWAGLAVDTKSTSVDLVKNAVSKDIAIQTEVSRYDMIRPLLQGSPPQVVKDSGGHVTVVPLIQFRPTRVANEPAAGSAAARPGEAIDGLDRIGPDTFRTDRGLWTDAIVRHYAGDYVPGGGLEIASVDTYGNVTISAGATAAGGLDGLRASPDNFVVFDGTTYERSLALGQPYPFTAASLSAGATDLMPGYPGTEWYKVAAQRQEFTPFRVLTATGKIVTSFPIDQVGDSTKSLPAGVTSNAPYVSITSSLSPYLAAGDPSAKPTPIPPGDPNLATAPYSPYGASAGNPFEPNRAYNRAFNAYPDLQGTLQRFIDLRFVPNADGTPSPLCPIAVGGITGFATVDATTGGSVNRGADRAGKRRGVRAGPKSGTELRSGDRALHPRHGQPGTQPVPPRVRRPAGADERHDGAGRLFGARSRLGERRLLDRVRRVQPDDVQRHELRERGDPAALQGGLPAVRLRPERSPALQRGEPRVVQDHRDLPVPVQRSVGHLRGRPRHARDHAGPADHQELSPVHSAQRADRHPEIDRNVAERAPLGLSCTRFFAPTSEFASRARRSSSR